MLSQPGLPADAAPKERANPFQPVYDQCNHGTVAEKRLRLAAFPRYLDVELTNHCNFRCLMCYTGSGMSRRRRGYMSREHYDRLLAEAAEHGAPLRFIRWGEPTLHPRWRQMLGQAKAAGLAVHLTTNGSLLSEADLRLLVELPVDVVKFSFQGVDAKSYREMRNTDFFDQLLGVMECLGRIRGRAPHPFIQVSTSTTYETEEQRRRFRELVAPLADQVLVGRTNLYRLDLERVRLAPEELAVLRRLQAEQTMRRAHAECHEVCDKLSVNWDGSVSACCGDHDNLMVVGGLAEPGGLARAWASPAMERYRELLAQRRHDELELCRHCYDVHGLRAAIPRPAAETNPPRAAGPGPQEA
jgi:MoaA/NifB/PqqE/SkfB family radical SAM enzyme